MSAEQREELLPCPFCGAGLTQFKEGGKIWSGPKYSEPTSVSVWHWCEDVPGQPSRGIERVGRDKASAIAMWNMRAAHTAEPPINAAAQAALASDGNASLDYLGSNAPVSAPKTPPAPAAPTEPVAPLPSDPKTEWMKFDDWCLRSDRVLTAAEKPIAWLGWLARARLAERASPQAAQPPALPLDLDHEPADLDEAKEMLRRARAALSQDEAGPTA